MLHAPTLRVKHYLYHSSIFPLCRLARQVELQGYESMPKSKLFKELSERYNIDRLMRAEQRAEKKKKDVETERKRPLEEDEAQVQSSSSDKRTKSSSSSEIDPIMLCKISKKMKFEYKRPNGSTAYYNVESLIDYLISSGEFIDPQTRIPFSDEDLQAIDEKVQTILARSSLDIECSSPVVMCRQKALA